MIAVTAAAGLIALTKVLHVDHLISTIFPLVPFLYAVTYQFLEKNKAGRTSPSNESIEKKFFLPTIKIFNKISLFEILLAVFISLIIKVVIEAGFVFIHLKLNRQMFFDFYGSFDINTVIRFIISDHPWYSGNELYYLTMLIFIATMSSMGTGIWIGYTSKGNAILVGVIVGSIATMFNAATSMSLFYMKLEEITNVFIKSIGLTADIGLITIMGLQVLSYGFWSGIAKIEKENAQKKKR